MTTPIFDALAQEFAARATAREAERSEPADTEDPPQAPSEEQAADEEPTRPAAKSRKRRHAKAATTGGE